MSDLNSFPMNFLFGMTFNASTLIGAGSFFSNVKRSRVAFACA